MTRKFTEKRLLVATHNAGKLAEIREMAKAFGVEVIGAEEAGLAEPIEDGATFVENARIKSRAGCEATGMPCLADDSGIEIDALGGAPGVHTADWAETGQGRDFELAMRTTWEKLEDIGAPFPRSARFCCTFLLRWPDGHEEVFEGVMPGQIVWPMRGGEGHGYDPIFQPDGFDQTFGEMSPEQKNRISHRADAFQKLAVVFS